MKISLVLVCMQFQLTFRWTWSFGSICLPTERLTMCFYPIEMVNAIRSSQTSFKKTKQGECARHVNIEAKFILELWRHETTFFNFMIKRLRQGLHISA